MEYIPNISFIIPLLIGIAVLGIIGTYFENKGSTKVETPIEDIPTYEEFLDALIMTEDYPEDTKLVVEYVPSHLLNEYIEKLPENE